ncbi:RluA family pseudouridine synthase [Methyloversatilis sp.]|uniref:RluA family pseudouridine synthase n=1 Tax=Methyloversatilis sp. TaxID=2569862 RepID=UPI0027B9C26A|nr:RluA family pseudouridine synthase [Methyloversatilis sp.]
MKELGKAPKVVRHVVDIEEAGQRIDNFLIRICKGVPKSHVYRVLRSGEVRVNSKRVDQTYRLAESDEVRIPPMRLAEPGAPAPVPSRDFDILYEDDAFLALNKPAGMAVHGGSGVSFGVIESLRRARPDARLLELAHRLDRETSGILLIAKKRSALTALHDAFRDGGMEKHYFALVSGRWMNPQQHIKLALTKYLTESGERRVSVDSEGKAAHSIVRLEVRWPGYSMLDVRIKTGRTHQIRVHLSASGFPIVGDEKYGDFALNKALRKEGLPRMFLHAHSLALKHPLTGEPVELAAPLPADLAGFVRRIDQQQTRELERKDPDPTLQTDNADGHPHARTV